MPFRGAAIWFIALHVGAEFVRAAGSADALAAQRGFFWGKSRHADTTVPLPAASNRTAKHGIISVQLSVSAKIAAIIRYYSFQRAFRALRD